MHTVPTTPPFRLRHSDSAARRRGWLLAALTGTLVACGGGAEQPAPFADETVLLSLGAEPTESATSMTVDARVEPLFHAAPVLLAEPDDGDAADPAASARRPPRVQALPDGAAAMDTRRLTVQGIQDGSRRRALAAPRAAADGTAQPAASGGSVSTYTPAQIRAAYGLPALPPAGVTPTAEQAAQMGAGQTIYILAAQGNPQVAAELAAFNKKFGLPACATRAIAVQAALPLPAAVASEGCTLSVVNTTPAGAMTGTAAAYESGWATEIALDVQWAHATAPLARLVLVQAPDPSINSLVAALKLVNRMGPGVVSMSLGTREGSWTAQMDSAFTGSGMSYLAATGDWGTGVYWPSVSAQVVAVGGTTLTWGGSGSRSEVAWSGTGGGISQYVATPSYQKTPVPGLGTVARRSVGDVAFNADPASGQYVAVMTPGSTAVNWISVGGTSLSTPQWAGLVAVANALRARSGKAVLGSPHALLYSSIGSVPGTYAGAFADIQRGSNGSCTTCSAKLGYDTPTGLGTPNAGGLLAALSATTASAPAPAPAPTPVSPTPVVASVSASGRVGTTFSTPISVQAANPVSYALSGAPAGLVIGATGVVQWPSPVAGNYSVGITATDTRTGAVGKGTLTLSIAAATAAAAGAPVLTVTPLTGVAGKGLTGSIGISDPAGLPMSLQISGVPAGMGFALSGRTLLLSWPLPVTGSYALQLIARNSAGATSTATLPITITAK